MNKKYLAILILSMALLFATESQAKDNYSIELIIFKQDASYSNEAWPDNPEWPDQSKAVGNLRSTQPKEQLALSPVSYTLRKNGLTPLLHAGWTQFVKKWKSPDWRWIDNGNLQGLIRVTKGRFLHIDLDLIYRNPTDGRTYPIIASRKMRSDELHYIDHPVAGVLVKIR